MIIDKVLYRGDGDPHNLRNVKQTLDHGLLQTNLIKGGIGKQIELPLQHLVNKHVGIGWDKTHFLSFSTNEDVAFRYGIGCSTVEYDTVRQDYLEFFDNNTLWSFAMLEIDLSRMNIQVEGQGIYSAVFTPQLIDFARYTHEYRIVIVDVLSYLLAHKIDSSFDIAISNAQRDEEWLILPATIKALNVGKYEFSAILDAACLSKYTKYSNNPSAAMGSFLGIAKMG